MVVVASTRVRPGRVFSWCSEIAPVAQLSVEEFWVCVEELTAPLDVVGEDGVNKISCGCASLIRYADRCLVPGLLGVEAA